MPHKTVRIVIDSRDRLNPAQYEYRIDPATPTATIKTQIIQTVDGDRRNLARFAVSWDSFAGLDVKKIKVRAAFSTVGACYGNITPPTTALTTGTVATTDYAGYAMINTVCLVCVRFNAGADSSTSGPNARRDTLLTVNKSTDLFGFTAYESQHPILQLNSVPSGILEISLLRASDLKPLQATVTKDGIPSTLSSSYLANDSGEWILTLLMDVEYI